jgi:hypothetical protein
MATGKVDDAKVCLQSEMHPVAQNRAGRTPAGKLLPLHLHVAHGFLRLHRQQVIQLTNVQRKQSDGEVRVQQHIATQRPVVVDRPIQQSGDGGYDSKLKNVRSLHSRQFDQYRGYVWKGMERCLKVNQIRC